MSEDRFRLDDQAHIDRLMFIVFRGGATAPWQGPTRANWIDLDNVKVSAR